MSPSLEGKVAVVTGASRGLGRDVAAALADAGALVAEVARTAEGFPCDVSQLDEVERLRARVEAELGPPQILVNAAGIFGPVEPLTRAAPERWIETVLVDLIGPYLTCRAFAPAMIELGWGRIVNVTSAASLHPPGPLNSAYGTAKVALNQFTRHLAAEIAGTGVTANVIHPGDLKTDMWADIRDKVSRMGPEADGYRQWVEWVDSTGGDPLEKAVDLIDRLTSDAGGEVNGRFCWIDEPLQAPIASWDDTAGARPWIEGE
jgi:NAD(P)-dependent dehydrogenase (short-subunit alcohol dehydrogenase family)